MDSSPIIKLSKKESSIQEGNMFFKIVEQIEGGGRQGDIRAIKDKVS